MKTATMQRAALNPAEFGAIFGRSKSWTYRMIYCGKIKTIQSVGSVMIPASEVDRILSTASDDYKPSPNQGRKAGA